MARPFRLAQSLFVLGAVVATWACSSSPSSPSPPLTGMWGGNDIALTVTGTGTHVEFDCAHGDIPGTLMVDTRNVFDVQGTYVREHGGPIRVGDVPDSHPAAYVGSVTATTMVLTARLTDTNEVIGTFTLSRGSPGRVVKCLLPLRVDLSLAKKYLEAEHGEALDVMRAVKRALDPDNRMNPGKLIEV